jgi:hypothetical protein
VVDVSGGAEDDGLHPDGQSKLKNLGLTVTR